MKGQQENAQNYRVSVTFEPEQYEHLLRISEQKRVSLAWVVRDAVEKTLKDEIPLFRGGHRAVAEESRSRRG